MRMGRITSNVPGAVTSVPSGGSGVGVTLAPCWPIEVTALPESSSVPDNTLSLARTPAKAAPCGVTCSQTGGSSASLIGSNACAQAADALSRRLSFRTAANARDRTRAS